MKNIRNNKSGFTLIELMIVVAIIGILTAVAVPSYQHFVTKAKVSEVITMLGSTRTAVTIEWQINGTFSGAKGLIPDADSCQYCSHLEWSMTGDGKDAWVSATLENLSSDINGKSIQLHFRGDGNRVKSEWVGTATAYLPPNS